MFAAFLSDSGSEVWPVVGMVTFLYGHVDCSVHSEEVDEEEDSGWDDRGVPVL
jgi:hypothetical protein